MTAEKGKFMKKTAAVIAGAILALGAAVPAFADAGAQGTASNSPGAISGDVIEVPVHVPVNACGDTVDVIALLNPALGNPCVND
ncbi:chaplin [Streptomyces sp.]|jgi:ChpA-C|uniref:chaplin n=1 Tax=Streptomyces sp. TaxID=1931 RepID=UPI0025F93CB1|nr:chaplin [Streptomyces sp.]